MLMLLLVAAPACSHLLPTPTPVAADCSAARALARKLAEEKQAAVNAARLAADQSMDEEEIEALKVCVRVQLCKLSLHTAEPEALSTKHCGKGCISRQNHC